MKNLLLNSLVLILLLLSPNSSLSQKLVSDSLVLDLSSKLTDSLHHTANIDTVLDIREVDDHSILTVSEKTHYGIVPVDYRIKAKKPLNHVIQENLPSNNSEQELFFSLGLKHFELSTGSLFWLFENYRLKALLEIYDHSKPDSLSPIGELIFDSKTKEFFLNADLKKGYEKVFRVWRQELVKNLESVSLNLKNNQNPLPYNFRNYQSGSPWMQLYTGADFIYLQKGFLIDGYLTFTYPETKRLFNKFATILRFRREKKFDSIEYGLINSSFHYRVNYTFLLQFKSDLFLGINRWKDMNIKKHKVYDALIGDLSFSQSFLFFPIHKKTFFCGAGLFQNLYYVYSKNFKFQPGLKINVGLQL